MTLFQKELSLREPIQNLKNGDIDVSKQRFGIFFRSISFVLREKILKPWKDFSKTKLVFSFAEKYLGKSAFSFVSFSLGEQRK
jgi:hypothetical protein